MKVMFNVTGSERKALVSAIGEVLGEKPRYLGVVTQGYSVGSYEIDRHGVLTARDGADQKATVRLLSMLIMKGYTGESMEEPGEPDVGQEELALDADTAEAQEESSEIGDESDAGQVCEPEETPDAEQPTDALESDAGEPEEAAPTEATAPEPTTFTIEMPLEGFTDAKVRLLEQLIHSKASLIKKSLGASALEVVRCENRLRFPWFDRALDSLEIKTYTHFISALCQAAKEATRVSGIDKEVPSERFTFRIFLLKLGFKGAEFKAERELLYRDLTGDCAFNSTDKRDAHAQKWGEIRKQRAAAALSNQAASEEVSEPETPPTEQDAPDAAPEVTTEEPLALPAPEVTADDEIESEETPA